MRGNRTAAPRFAPPPHRGAQIVGDRRSGPPDPAFGPFDPVRGARDGRGDIVNNLGSTMVGAGVVARSGPPEARSGLS